MTLNSFCVKVQFCNAVIHHERPVTFDEAKSMYMTYLQVYFRPGASGTMYGSPGDMSDKLIRTQMQRWVNFPQHLNWIVDFSCVSNQGSYTVELMHSRKS